MVEVINGGGKALGKSTSMVFLVNGILQKSRSVNELSSLAFPSSLC